MQKNYYNLLIAGFDQDREDKLIKLLEQVQTDHLDVNIKVQTAHNYNDITAALNENFYKVCLLNSELKHKINKKFLEELQNRLNIQNKYTALVHIDTEDNKKSDLQDCEEQSDNIQYKLSELNSYWLYNIITTAIKTTKQQKEIKRLSHYDNLTGLVNRNLYLNHLNHALALSERQKRFCTMIYCDINNFKDINKKYGLKYGDLVLMECAQRIKKSIRSVDLAARLGSDEFAILVENCTPKEAKRIIDDIKQAMKMPFNINVDKIKINCSIDSASYPDSYNDMTSFLRDVRQAHYLAKTIINE